MLGANHDVGDANGFVVVVVFNRHLALTVGAQIGHLPAFFANFSQGAHQNMCQF